MRLSIPLVVGVGLLVALAPFAWYRIEIGAAHLRISEFPNEAEFAIPDVAVAELMPGKRGRRLRLQMKGGHEFFINESDIGKDSFVTVKAAIEKLLQREVD